jgi:hypothetical protein
VCFDARGVVPVHLKLLLATLRLCALLRPVCVEWQHHLYYFEAFNLSFIENGVEVTRSYTLMDAIAHLLSTSAFRSPCCAFYRVVAVLAVTASIDVHVDDMSVQQRYCWRKPSPVYPSRDHLFTFSRQTPTRCGTAWYEAWC